MKITKELLERLGVVSTVLQAKGRPDTLCAAVRFKQGLLELFVHGGQFPPQEEAVLQIRFAHELCAAKVFVKESAGGYAAAALAEPPSGRAADFFNRLSELEGIDEKFGRRKERRIKIGKEMSEAFGLERPVQKLFAAGASESLPCVLQDVSIHGLKVIAPFAPLVRKADFFVAQISFKRPASVVMLKVHKVGVQLAKGESKTFANISCQILEPVHFEWKERVARLLT